MTLRPFTKDFNTGFGMGGEAIANYGNSAYENNSSGSRRGTSRGRERGETRMSRAQRRLNEMTSGTNLSTKHQDLELDQRTNHTYNQSQIEKPKDVTIQENYLGEHDNGRSPPQSPGSEQDDAIGNTTTITYAAHALTTNGRHQNSGSRGSERTNPDEITVTHLVEQKVRPRNMV